jgi:Tol biopolymer transport system component/DNA-binding winged helix-turn-helix (wHTH) protein
MSSKVRFGVYDLDIAGMELRKSGVRIRLQDQPFRILQALVEKPGEVVGREELKSKIWSNDTFVDFDQSLNKAVNRLREVLNDDASRPKYIETIPRRGYRFVAPVTDMSSSAQVVAEPAPPVTETTNTTPQRRPGRILAVAGATFVVVALIVAIQQYIRSTSRGAAGAARLLIPDAYAPRLSSDGKLVAYMSTAGGDVAHIWVRQTAGEKRMQVTKGTSRDLLCDLSPDGTQILFFSDRAGVGVYQIPTFQGEARLVVPGATGAQFSPDGQLILFWTNDAVRNGHARVLVGSVNGSDPFGIEAINHDYLILGHPFWSADSSGIVFFGRRHGKSEKLDGWWLASLSGGAPKRFAIPGLERVSLLGLEILTWARQRDDGASIVYSVRRGDVSTLFRIALSKTGQPVGTSKQLSSSAGLLPSASMGDNGKLVYEVVTRSRQIFEIPVDKEGRKVGLATELPLTEGLLYYSPSVSRDGRWVVYVEAEHGKRTKKVILRDLAAGTDRVLDWFRDDPPFAEELGSASISPDGSKVVFGRLCLSETLNCPSYVVPALGGQPEQLCENCTSRGFSSDASFVLMQTYAGQVADRDRIVAVDLQTKRQRDFLSDPDRNLYHPFLSWDDRWVAFKKDLVSGSQIMIAPVKDGRPGMSAEWISVTDGRYSDDKPQFSPDGKAIYFTSLRDGHLCIWKQLLDSITKHPVGAPEGYEHFHSTAGSDGSPNMVSLWFSDLTVGRDKILISLPHPKHDLWVEQVN